MASMPSRATPNGWADSAHVVVGREGRSGPSRHLHRCRVMAATARVVHRFDSEHDAPGLACRPTEERRVRRTGGRRVFQIFRDPGHGGAPAQVTTRSVAQDTARVVAGWKHDRVHGVELRGAILDAETLTRRGLSLRLTASRLTAYGHGRGILFWPRNSASVSRMFGRARNLKKSH